MYLSRIISDIIDKEALNKDLGVPVLNLLRTSLEIEGNKVQKNFSPDDYKMALLVVKKFMLSRVRQQQKNTTKVQLTPQMVNRLTEMIKSSSNTTKELSADLVQKFIALNNGNADKLFESAIDMQASGHETLTIKRGNFSFVISDPVELIALLDDHLKNDLWKDAFNIDQIRDSDLAKRLPYSDISFKWKIPAYEPTKILKEIKERVDVETELLSKPNGLLTADFQLIDSKGHEVTLDKYLRANLNLNQDEIKMAKSVIRDLVLFRIVLDKKGELPSNEIERREFQRRINDVINSQKELMQLIRAVVQRIKFIKTFEIDNPKNAIGFYAGINGRLNVEDVLYAKDWSWENVLYRQKVKSHENEIVEFFKALNEIHRDQSFELKELERKLNRTGKLSNVEDQRHKLMSSTLSLIENKSDVLSWDLIDFIALNPSIRESIVRVVKLRKGNEEEVNENLRVFSKELIGYLEKGTPSLTVESLLSEDFQGDSDSDTNSLTLEKLNVQRKLKVLEGFIDKEVPQGYPKKIELALEIKIGSVNCYVVFYGAKRLRLVIGIYSHEGVLFKTNPVEVRGSLNQQEIVNQYVKKIFPELRKRLEKYRIVSNDDPVNTTILRAQP